jgi:hypothetical protein
MRVIFLYYLCVVLIYVMIVLYIEIPLWLSYFNAFLAIMNFTVIYFFNKAMEVLPDED